MINKLRKVLLLIMIFLNVDILRAQFITSLTNPVARRAQSAYPVTAPSLEFLGPFTTIWYGKVQDTTCISSALLAGVGLNFAPWISVSLTVPYYYDIKKGPNATYRSPGLGDLRLAIELRKRIRRLSYLAFVPFFTIPSGDLRDVPPSRVSSDEDYIGGLFRDYSTTSYDYGVELLYSTRCNRLNFNFNLGFWNAYQMYFMGKSGNLGYIVLNGMFNAGVVNPFVEFYYSKFQDNVFGNAPVFITPGLKISLYRRFRFNISADFPLFQRGNVQLLSARIAPQYAGFLSQFPDFTPSFSLNIGMQFTPALLHTDEKATVVVIVKDRKTGKPINGADCYLDEKYTRAKNGTARFGIIDKGIYRVRVIKGGYLPQEKFVKVDETQKPVEISLEKDKFTLSLKVTDIDGNPVNAKVIFPDVGSKTFKTGDDGAVEFLIRKSKNVYPAYVWAKGYLGDNVLIYTPEDADTLSYEVKLFKYEGGGLELPCIYFGLNSAELKKDYIPFLDQIGRYLVKHPDVKLEIQGYASSDGPERFNEKLSLNRARACKNYLVERYKISSDRLLVIGFGERNPAMPNVGKKREINRRVEFNLLK